MKIDNATHWKTEHLAAFVKRVAETELDPEKRAGFTVRVRYGTKSKWTSGHAQYHGRYIQVNVGSVEVDRINLAHTIAHEFAHTRGMTHRQMRGSERYRYVAGWREFYAWAETLPLEKQEAKPAVPLDAKREARHAHCEGKVKEWERRRKAAETKLKAWRRRLRSVESRIAASGLPAVIPFSPDKQTTLSVTYQVLPSTGESQKGEKL